MMPSRPKRRRNPGSPVAVKGDTALTRSARKISQRSASSRTPLVCIRRSSMHADVMATRNCRAISLSRNVPASNGSPPYMKTRPRGLKPDGCSEGRERRAGLADTYTRVPGQPKRMHEAHLRFACNASVRPVFPLAVAREPRSWPCPQPSALLPFPRACRTTTSGLPGHLAASAVTDRCQRRFVRWYMSSQLV
jgi:hypothetical protein